MPKETPPLVAPLSKGQAKLLANIEAEANAVRARLSAVVSTVLAGLDVDGPVNIVSMDLTGDSPCVVYRLNNNEAGLASSRRSATE